MSRAEAERLLGVAEKLLQSRDLNGSKDFAVLAQETEPLLDGPDQILAVVDVLLASDKRIPSSSGSATVPDWYSILQLPRRSDDPDLVKKQFRRLALLLHPDKNKFPFAGQAFQLVTDALFVLSDPAQKARYDGDLGPFSKVDLPDPSPSSKLPVKRNPKPAKAPDSASGGGNRRVNKAAKTVSFWTVCPYCYMLFEYPKAYENCCLKCQSCEKAFHGAVITSMPPIVPGKEAYFCTWGLFPLGFMFKGSEGKIEEFPGWKSPPVFGNGMQQQQQQQQQGSWPEAGMGPARVQQPPQPQPAVAAPSAGAVGHNRGGGGTGPEAGKKKRGRPRKYPVQT